MLSTALLVAASMVAGQGASPADHNPLDELEWLVGCWKFEFEAKEAGPGVEVGDKMLFHSSYQWTLDKNAVLFEWYDKKAGSEKPLFMIRGIMGWHPKREVFLMSGFSSTGNYGRATWKKLGDDWQVRQTVIERDGTVSTSTMVVSDIKTSTHVVTTTKKQRNGEDEPPGEAVTMTRCSCGERANVD
jgi:hypothetical protein